MVDAGPDQLHQVFVGRDDGHVAAGFDDVAGIGRDQVVGLIAVLFDGGDVEGFDRIADQRELRDEFFGRRRTLRFVFVVDLVAKGFASGIENDGDVGWRFRRLALAQQLPQHGAKAVHRADRQSVGRPRQRRQRVEGAEDVARSVNQIDVAAFDDGHGLAVGNGDAVAGEIVGSQLYRSFYLSWAGL